MSADFWTGLLFSIPVSVLGNLLVEPTKRFWARYVRSQKNAGMERLKGQYRQAVMYHGNPALFDKMMFHAVITVLRECARVGAAASFAFVLRVVLGPGPAVHWLYLIVGFFAFSEFTSSISTCRDVMEIWGRVWNFDDYKRKLPPEITAMEVSGGDS